MAEPVIIVDADGVEHEFPAGFDPIRAAAIVHAQKDDRGIATKALDVLTQPTAPGLAAQRGAGALANKIDTTERTPVHGSIKEAVSAVPDVLSGLAHHPIETLRGGVAGITQGVGDVLAANSSPAALAALASGGAGKVAKAGYPILGNLLRIGGGGANALFGTEGARQALTAPDAEGKLIGATQAAAATAGILHDPATMEAARLGARTLGKGMVEASKRPGYVRGAALGVMGGSGVAGHPIGGLAAGLPMMALPPALEAAGSRLIRFGTKGADILPLGASTGAQPLARPEGGRTPYGMPEAGPITTEPAAPKSNLDAATLARLRRQGMPEETIAKIDAAAAPKPKPAAPKPAPSQMLPDIEPDAVPPSSPLENGLPPGQGPGGLPRAAQELAAEGSQDYMHSQFAKNRRVVDALRESYDNPLTQGMTSEERARYVGNRVRPSRFEEQMMKTDLGDLPPDAVVTGEANYDPSNPPPGPAIGGELPPSLQMMDELQANRPAGTGAGTSMEGSAKYDSSQPPAGPAIGDESAMGTPQMSFEEMMAAAGPEENLGQGAINLEGPNVVPDEPLPSKSVDVPPARTPKPKSERVDAADKRFWSSSKRGKAAMSKTPGYTIADIESVGLNPNVRYKNFDPEQHAELLRLRAGRSSMYRTNTGLDKGFNRAMEAE